MTCKHDAIQTWRTDDGTPVMWSCVDCSRKLEPLIVPAAQIHTSVYPEYTPPQRQWVGLTDEDYLNALDLHPYEGTDREFWNVLEAKLKEKNT